METMTTMEGLETPGTCSNSFATVMRRRAVSSLSPAKERRMLANIHPQNGRAGTGSVQFRPPLTRSSTGTNGKTKSSNLAAGSRPPTKPPPLPRCSVALSQEETCLVSAAGDVLVCRSREFAQLMVDHSSPRSDADSVAASNASLRWCDLECSEFPMTLEKSSLCNPWLTHAIAQREEKKEDDRGSSHRHLLSANGGGLRGGGGSTYEWGVQTVDPTVDQASRGFGQLELEVANSPSPRDPHSFDGGDDEDRVLSMPSFDYSHFGNGGNDMLPVSPARTRPRRLSDLAEIDVNLSLKLPPYAPTIERHTSRSASAAAFSTLKNHTTISQTTQSIPPLYHGVPTFLPSISQVRIQQVSAHPRGSHVLMISAEALLFSYGLNDHGQLGIGIKSPAPGKGTESHQRYVWTPTIITPLLENGGKAITCAAGESHSLVVVCTEGRRILKTRSPRSDGSPYSSPVSGSPVPIQMNRVSSSPPTMDVRKDHCGDESEHSSSSATSAAAESVCHHQLYGFGRNNFTKIGLVHPRRKPSLEQPVQSQAAPVTNDSHLTDESHKDDMEDVLLPHRVALHCTVWPEKGSSEDSQRNTSGTAEPSSGLPPQGIFALAASSEHSAALVRRATGDIELYTWGNAAYHALGMSSARSPESNTIKIVPVPTLVKQLSQLSQASQTESKDSYRLLEQNPPEFPVDVSLGPYSSFVVTSKGRCLSFGISYDGMLGQGRSVTDVQEPKAIKFPNSNASSSQICITSVSAGTGHVMALAKCGTVFTWGKNADGRLGLGDNSFESSDDDGTDLERAIVWTPQKMPHLSKAVTPSRLPPTSGTCAVRRNAGDDEFGPVVQVCAGLDCSVLVTACGKVFSCGKHSGRLGLGEVNHDVSTPTPLFGGLSLWHRPVPARSSRRDKASSSPAKNRPILKRGMTTG